METATQHWTDIEEMQESAKDALEGGREKINRITENMASKTPSFLFLGIALAFVAASAFFQIQRKRHLSLFIGQWVPSILLLGLYNKFAKTIGAD